jgi:amino acid permease
MESNFDKEKYSETGSGSDALAEKPQFSPSQDAEHGEVKTVELKRKLQSRHLQMIAIGMSNFVDGQLP